MQFHCRFFQYFFDNFFVFSQWPLIFYISNINTRLYRFLLKFFNFGIYTSLPFLVSTDIMRSECRRVSHYSSTRWTTPASSAYSLFAAPAPQLDHSTARLPVRVALITSVVHLLTCKNCIHSDNNYRTSVRVSY